MLLDSLFAVESPTMRGTHKAIAMALIFAYSSLSTGVSGNSTDAEVRSDNGTFTCPVTIGKASRSTQPSFSVRAVLTGTAISM